jgi:Response regulators consisting of a CheY-like receiver domain and a winged-helix DNA-binding domain
MANEKILVVDDEKDLSMIVCDYLKNEQYVVESSFDGQDALDKFGRLKPDLVILDIMLPKIDGMEVCRNIRAKSRVPIIMLSAKSSDVDKILSLGLGADDYITKPFSPGELVARVKAHLRRYTQLSERNVKEDSKDILDFGDLVINNSSYTVTYKNKDVVLAAREFELLSLLASNPYQVFTREQLYDRIWGFNDFGDITTVTVHIRKIREKIEGNPASPVYLKTVWGVGYKFEGVLKNR